MFCAASQRWAALAVCCALGATAASALDPAKSLTQYTRTVWTQQHGLPQDTIRAIAQTTDGYLWLGTDEGLASFDGYDFTVYNRDRGDLPGNSVTALAAARDGSLWIGTSDGLSHYRNKRFTTYTVKDGLPENFINSLAEDHTGALWVVAGISLVRFDRGRFTRFAPESVPIAAVRTVYEDSARNLWIAGFSGVARLAGGRFATVIPSGAMGGDIVSTLLRDHRGTLWVAGSTGLIALASDGHLRTYTARDGLPDPFVRALWEDRDGNLWAGTNGGLSRLENGRFVAPPLDKSRDRDWVRAIFEDREGDLWVGMNSGLNRFRDDLFTIYGRNEGLPSDEPTTVYQDRAGQTWIGFHDNGLARLAAGGWQVFSTENGLASNEIFSIRDDREGGLLIATREGVSRLRQGRFQNLRVPDPLGRNIVFDVLQDRSGRLWVAAPSGLNELAGGRARVVIDGGPLLPYAVVVLAQTRDGSIWAGTYGRGLWRLRDGEKRLFTTRDGLSSDQIRALYEDPDGTLWVGTFGGGLDALRGGRIERFTARDGLLSDNISHVEDDGAGSLWLSTTRGVCRVNKGQMAELAQGRIRRLTPVNYGVRDGLRSAQCAPGYPTSGGGERTSDGRLWFPTSRGLAVLDPRVRSAAPLPATVHLIDMIADGKPMDLAAPASLAPGSGRIQFRYTGIHLSAPERVEYSYRLVGLDREWVQAGSRRITTYTSLPHGEYRFEVRAAIDGAPAGEIAYSFRLLPHFYETRWFQWLCAALLAAALWATWRLRVRQIRGRFALVLEERARLAREIHDTLAQGFVGISSQLDAVALLSSTGESSAARQHLELAQRMARHSLTEARRSVMDLRASALEGHDLAAALQAGAKQWTQGSPLQVQLKTEGELPPLPEETEQHVLRIAQEAVTNVMKHAGARQVNIGLAAEARRLRLRVEDDGRGFDPRDAFSAAGGHFGLIGMRERAERLGGELTLASVPGQGTRLEVSVPL